MLTRITLTNFFSLRDLAIIDFKVPNARIYKNPQTENNTFVEHDNTLLKSIALFGANASGKSNLLRAIEVCLHYIRESHSYTESSAKLFEQYKFQDIPEPSSFEIELFVEGERYEYGFSIISGRVVAEYLFSYPKRYKSLVFKRETDERGEEKYTFSKKFIRPKEVVANTSPYTLFLTRAALMNRVDAIRIFNFVTDRMVVGLPKFEDLAFEGLLQNHKDIVLEALKFADSDIINYELVENSHGSAGKKMITYHKCNPSKPFDFNSEESAGTRRLLGLLGAFIEASDNGKVLIIDELESSLHPQLVKYAVRLFNHSERAQLIFSTHVLDLLNVGIFRPDQIYFVSKDYSNGSSELYSLADFAEYKNYKNLRRDYDQGRFNAIPILPTL